MFGGYLPDFRGVFSDSRAVMACVLSLCIAHLLDLLAQGGARRTQGQKLKMLGLAVGLGVLAFSLTLALWRDIRPPDQSIAPGHDNPAGPRSSNVPRTHPAGSASPPAFPAAGP